MDLMTSCIRHPSNSPFIIRRQYQVEFCVEESDDGRASVAETCAELLGIFEFHTNNPYKNKILINLVESAKRKHGRTTKDHQNWLPYSYAYLRELLFYSRGKRQILEAVRRLEQK